MRLPQAMSMKSPPWRAIPIKTVLMTIIAISLLLNTSYSGVVPPESQNGMDSHLRVIHDQVITPQADGSKGADVEGLLITRERGTLELTKGRLFLCKPIEGVIKGAVFYGKGKFTLSAPTVRERQRIYRAYKTDTVLEPFKFLFMAFGDSTLTELNNKVTFEKKKVLKKIKRGLDLCRSYLDRGRGERYYHPGLKTVLNQTSNDFFYAHFADHELRPRIFQINPYAQEKVTYRRRQLLDQEYGFESICQFNTLNDENSQPPPVGNRSDIVSVESYSIDCSINKSLDFSATSTINLTTIFDNQQVLAFDLAEKLHVDSVFEGNGQPLEFFKAKGHKYLWIKPAKPLASGDQLELKVYYHGSIIFRDAKMVEIDDRFLWYPQAQTRKPALYEISFRHSKSIKVMTAGKLVSSVEEGGVVTDHWSLNEPSSPIPFNLGSFAEEQQDAGYNPNVRVFLKEGWERKSHRVSAGEESATQIARALQYFTKTIGPLSYDTILVTEGSNYGGPVVYPGGIIAPTGVFIHYDKAGYDLYTKSVLSANLWFGTSIRPKTYHDNWIGSGFPQYLGMLQMEETGAVEKGMYDMLEFWQRNIYESQLKKLHKGKEDSPIGYGFRTPRIIRQIKGAYVLHMLRKLLQDFDTGSDDTFIAVLQEFYRKYNNSFASIAEFKTTLEQVSQMELTWFFDQWIHGTHLPDYNYAYKTVKNSEAKYQISLQVKDEFAPDEFQMIVPILVIFGNNQFTQLRVVVRGKDTAVDLPLMPLEPQKIVFNYKRDVLCNTKEVKWQG